MNTKATRAIHFLCGLLVATAFTPAKANQWPSEHPIALQGTIITYYPSPALGDCQAACVGRAQCMGATWIAAGTYYPRDSAMCYLYSNVTGRAYARGHTSLVKTAMRPGGAQPPASTPPASPLADFILSTAFKSNDGLDTTWRFFRDGRAQASTPGSSPLTGTWRLEAGGVLVVDHDGRSWRTVRFTLDERQRTRGLLGDFVRPGSYAPYTLSPA